MRRSITVWYLGIWAAAVVVAWLIINSDDAVAHKSFDGLWPPWHPYYFNLLYAGFAIPPAIRLGLRVARSYGLQSHVGRAAMLFATGIVTWACGNLVWFMYNVDGTEVPYPSIADVGYLSLLPLWGAALAFLWMVIAVSWRDLLRLVWIPVVISAVTIYLVAPPFDIGSLHIENRSWLFDSSYSTSQTVFSTLYLVSDVVIMSMALILLVCSRRASGSTLFRPLLVVSISAMLLYVADLLFDSRVANGTYYNGDISDGLYWASLFAMLIALVSLRSSYDRLLAQFSSLDVNTSTADEGVTA
jgi:hypothetical protein